MNKNLFQIGQRVNVSAIVNESWQSKHELSNGLVNRIEGVGDSMRITVKADDESFVTYPGGYNPLASGGTFYLTSYKIDPS